MLFGDGEIDAAETLIRRFLVETGDHPEAMRLLGQIGPGEGGAGIKAGGG